MADNGTGMTNAEFNRRWRKLYYNRLDEQGLDVRFPIDGEVSQSRRLAFGRNGIGRWASFCFGDSFLVDTIKDGDQNRYRVNRARDLPFSIIHETVDRSNPGHGTTITIEAPQNLRLTPEEIRNEIGMRFLTDPNFEVHVNNEVVAFEDVNIPNKTILDLDVGEGQKVQLIIIDTQLTDRTAKQHGVAWHVHGRLVGSCSWSGVGSRTDDIIDRRRIAAKRFTFIVKADYLGDAGAVRSDWSGFDEDNEGFKRAAKVIYEKVGEHLLSVSEADRQKTMVTAREHNRETLKVLSPLDREKWTTFVTEAQEKCPSVREADIIKLSEVMANLELSKSGYDLIHKLSHYGPNQLDDLHRVLEEWTLDMVKEVLDVIAKRLKLIEELQVRMSDVSTREVQDLQPLFEKGLWIFGPEFETIDYTSNRGMTRVIQELFGRKDIVGSLLRPDFAILPESSIGLYSYPRYDRDGGEVGTEKLVILELKRSGVKVGEGEKTQCWKYVKELFTKGLLQAGVSHVKCFVVGEEVDKFEASERSEMEGGVVITPLLFETVLARAKSRMLNLHKRVENAPFLDTHRKEIEEFLKPVEVSPNLFDQAAEQKTSE